MVTWDNYEEMMMLYADGELGHEDELALMAFVETNPELKNELALFGHTRLTYDPSEVYPDKSSLLKTEPAKRIIGFPAWRRYSIAAGIAALIFIGLFRYLPLNKDNGVIVKKDTVKPQTPILVLSKVDSTRIETPQNQALHTSPVPAPANFIAHNKKNNPVKQEIKEAPVDQKVAEKRNTEIHDSAIINTLTVAAIKEIPGDNVNTVIVAVKDIPNYTVKENTNVVKKTLWDRLPIDDLKKKKLAAIAGAVANISGDADADNDGPDEKNVSVKIQKRKLMISF